ncbi:MAG TPA: zinc-binding alcohol dehydrogenase [Chloroflexota bacterium]|nr:zinc-binding alcohol dehydrogenase [Chloroflexota bacterium]
MKQVVSNNLGEVYVREAPMPRLEGSGAIVQTICSVFGAGSELGGLRRRRQQLREQGKQAESGATGDTGERPRSYQSCGRIVELSDDLKGTYEIGDVVACAGSGFGHHAEYGFVTRNTMARVPEGLAPEEAATCNVGLTGLHALRRAQFQAGELIAVIGLGMVGQLTCQLAMAFGGRAIGTDLYPLRLEKAQACGVEVVDAQTGDLAEAARRLSGGVGADHVAVSVVSGTKELSHLAVRALRPSGVLLLIGGYAFDFSGAAADANPHTKEIDVRFVYGRGPGSRDPEWNAGRTDYPSRFMRWTAKSNLEALLQLQASGRVNAAPLLTHRFPVEQASEAADLLIEHPEQALGVVLTYGA